MYTTSQTIQKYQAALQELVDLIKKENGHVPSIQMQGLTKKNKVSNTITTDAMKVGLIERLDRGVYKAIITKIEPIHARKVIEHRRESIKKRRVELKFLDKKIKDKLLKKESKKHLEFKGTRLLKSANDKKTFSLFWGLIKFNF
jgi:hypothetical protein